MVTLEASRISRNGYGTEVWGYAVKSTETGRDLCTGLAQTKPGAMMEAWRVARDNGWEIMLQDGRKWKKQ